MNVYLGDTSPLRGEVTPADVWSAEKTSYPLSRLLPPDLHITTLNSDKLPFLLEPLGSFHQWADGPFNPFTAKHADLLVESC